MLWYWWQKHQHGYIEPVDIPNCPRELNYYEKFWVRFMFADIKVFALLAGGLVFGVLNWVFLKYFGMWFI